MTLEAPPIGLAPRQLAWQVLQAVAGGAYADGALERQLRRQPLPPLDRALATELAYGAIRQRGLLDGWLDTVGKVPAERQPPQLRWLLHVGLQQLLFSDRVPAAAAVSTTVELAKRGGLARLAPVVNGLLRQVLRRRAAVAEPGAGPLEPWSGLVLPADPAASLALRRSLPLWFAQLLLQWLPGERAEAVAEACNQSPPLDLRVNPLRGSRAALLEALAAAGVTAERLAELEFGLSLGAGSGDLRQLPGYAEGQWCVQDRSAQQVVPLLDPQPGELVVDACAAPGGKATQIAELMGDRGAVWAVDRAEPRLRRVRANAERLGLTAVHPLAADAVQLAALRPEWVGRVDRLLLDAPCSGLGTLARHADARWRITPAAIAELVALQRQLLEAGATLLKPGGVLVYATCTVHPAENAELIEAFLAAHPGWQLERSWQRWPQAAAGASGGGDGFYAARLRAPAP
ncbi:MAG: Ribosomal small subunit methyltransferase [Cyanobacteriota bacterium]